LRVRNAKTRCAIPLTKIKEPMISAIPKEIVSGRMMARIPQTKVTMLQTINHGDTFFMAGPIDSMFVRVTDRSLEFVQLLELPADYIARRDLN
jgi:hypothetical protein